VDILTREEEKAERDEDDATKALAREEKEAAAAQDEHDAANALAKVNWDDNEEENLPQSPSIVKWDCEDYDQENLDFECMENLPSSPSPSPSFDDLFEGGSQSIFPRGGVRRWAYSQAVPQGRSRCQKKAKGGKPWLWRRTTAPGTR
jgi:hypothetical protein